MGGPKLRKPGRIRRPKNPLDVVAKYGSGQAYLACIGLLGAQHSMAHADAIRDEAIRRGHPFVVWDAGCDEVPTGSILVMIAFGDQSQLQDIYNTHPHLPRIAPLVLMRNVGGEGTAVPGGCGQPDTVASIFDEMQRLVDNGARPDTHVPLDS